MSNNVGFGSSLSLTEKMLGQLQNVQNESFKSATSKSDDKSANGQSFMEHLKEAFKDVNQQQKTSDAMAIELSTGKSGNIHETMLAATKAELSFNLMVQLRNKALEAYTEVMRMPV